jgi:hypothetical protein
MTSKSKRFNALFSSILLFGYLQLSCQFKNILSTTTWYTHIIMKIIKNKTKNDKYEHKYVLGYQLVFNDGYVYLSISIVCDCHEKDITLIGNNFFS